MKDKESWEDDGFTPGFALIIGLVIFCLMLFGELMGGWFLIAMLLTSTALVIMTTLLFYWYYEGKKNKEEGK